MSRHHTCNASVILVACGLLISGAAFAAAPVASEHDGHDGHESPSRKGGMHQRQHGDMGQGDPMQSMFGKMDENKDGKLSRDEVQKGLDKMFADADVNKDGAITKEEMQSLHKRMHDKMQAKMQERWKAADKDGDGTLSRAEIDSADMPMLSRNFAKIDRNKDGKLTTEEMRSGMMPHRQPAPSPSK